MRRTVIATTLVFCVMAAGLLTGSMVATSAWAKGTSRYADLDTFAQAMHHIERHFVDEIDPKRLIYGAIEGMTRALDKHSVFLEPSELTESNVRTDGWYTGVGIEINQDVQSIMISRVIPDSPADMSGVLQGDLLVAVDHEPTQGRTLSEIGGDLRGAEGTTVHLALQRDHDPINLELIRTRVRDKAVRIAMIEPGWAVAEIHHFQRNVAADLRQGLRRVEADGGRPLQGLVIDLRDNPGGLLDEAVAITDLFLREGLVFESVGRGGNRIDSIHAQGQTEWPKTHIAILINHGSASASEIVAGALQAHKRALLVGESTYGKGSVQRMYVFEDDSALKLTVSRYHLANGKVVDDKEGIVPDVVVTAPSRRTEALDQLQHLTSMLPKTERTKTQAALDLLRTEQDTSIATHTNRKGTIQDRLTQDLQLRRAWKTIREKP